jgi:hypothetical protein
LKLAARLPFVFLCALFIALAHLHAASAATPTARPEPSELVRPSSGNDTFKLASLGVVFLIIGAAVVYAPNIVSAVTGLPRRMSGRAPKAKPAKARKPVAQPVRTVVAEEQATTVIDLPPPPPPPTRPPERRVEIPAAHDVVSKLQNEIRSAWSKTR